MTVRETIVELLDKNDPAMSHVVHAALMAMRSTGVSWQNRGLPGVPSVKDYAEAVRVQMREEYGV